MEIYIKTIPHGEQAYETVGNYWKDENGVLQVRVSDMGNDDYALLVALHEIIEQRLTEKRGISNEVITAYDEAFEKARIEYPQIFGDQEPGDSLKAPYREEHRFSTQVEHSISMELGVDWQEYNKTVNSL